MASFDDETLTSIYKTLKRLTERSFVGVYIVGGARGGCRIKPHTLLFLVDSNRLGE